MSVHHWLIFALLLHPAHAPAEALEQTFLHHLSRVRSPRQAQLLTHSYEQLKVARQACHIQLREHLVPVACYEWLAQARAHGLHLSEQKLTLALLNRQCDAAVENFNLPSESSNLTYVAAECARKIRSVRAIQVYRQSEQTWPEY